MKVLKPPYIRLGCSSVADGLCAASCRLWICLPTQGSTLHDDIALGYNSYRYLRRPGTSCAADVWEATAAHIGALSEHVYVKVLARWWCLGLLLCRTPLQVVKSWQPAGGSEPTMMHQGHTGTLCPYRHVYLMRGSLACNCAAYGTSQISAQSILTIWRSIRIRLLAETYRDTMQIRPRSNKGCESHHATASQTTSQTRSVSRQAVR